MKYAPALYLTEITVRGRGRPNFGFGFGANCG